MSDKKEDKKIKVGALWANEKDGKTYFTGKFGDAKLLVFENGFKESDKHPTHIVYLAPFEKKAEETKDAAGFDSGEEVPF